MDDTNYTEESLKPDQFSLLMSHVDKLRESLETRMDHLKRELQNIRDLLLELAEKQKNT